MEHTKSLLINLRSYRPREGRDSLENFVTEVFRWLLDTIPAAGEAVVELINSRLINRVPFGIAGQSIHWQSQFSLGVDRPDMVARWSDSLIVFEHKVWSTSYAYQVAKYKKLASEQFPNHQVAVVLIVPTPGEFQNAADVCLCWYDVYRCIEGCVNSGGIGELEKNYINEFLALLKYEGIGPPTPVSQAAIRYYPEASQLPNQLDELYRQLIHRPWVHGLSGYSLETNGSRWGRIGFYWSRTGSVLKWSPAIALCTVINGSDHCLTERMKSQPLKLQIIFSFSKEVHQEYRASNMYEAFKIHLQSLAGQTGATFYDHLVDKSSKDINFYHPLYLEWSLADILQGAETLDQQIENVLVRAQSVIDPVVMSQQLKDLQLDLDLFANKRGLTVIQE